MLKGFKGMSQGALTREHFASAWRYFKEYLQTTNGKKKAIFLLLATIATIALICYLNIIFSYWTTDFWGAITVKDFSLFSQCLESFVGLISAWVILGIAKNFFIESFSIDWRQWLTQKFLSHYTQTDKDNYLDLARCNQQLDNPQQRIQSDIKNFVGLTCWVTTDLFGSCLRLITFITSLWQIGGPLSFEFLGVSFWIPGYLVWLALIFAGVASIITQKIGRSMQSLSAKQEICEADFRKEMEQMANESESIAVEKGEGFYLNSSVKRLGHIISNLYEKLIVKLKVIGFQSFYKQAAEIFPYVAAAPLYFLGKNELGDLMQISYSFGEVNGALNWFVESYEKIADFQSSISRMMQLENALNDKPLNYQAKNINHHFTITKDILINELTITQPNQPLHLMQALNLSLKKGEDVVIRGDSGLGKSTLLKVIACTWRHGKGDILLPKDDRYFFMAQKPSIPHGVSLREILAYPGLVGDYDTRQFEDVLKMVGLEVFVSSLDKPAVQWFRTLSGGQQQRISFARALLKKPDWLFLDEATSSLDPKSESYLYTLIKNMLPNTTLVSIAHRDSVEAFHHKIINFFTDKESNKINFFTKYTISHQNQLTA